MSDTDKLDATGIKLLKLRDTTQKRMRADADIVARIDILLAHCDYAKRLIAANSPPADFAMIHAALTALAESDRDSALFADILPTSPKKQRLTPAHP